MSLGRWVGGDFAFVSESKADSLKANLAYPGDLVFTQRGTLGQVALVPYEMYERYLISQSQMKLTVDEAIANTKFLYYQFTSDFQQNYIRDHAISAGVPHTNLSILRKTPIVLPPLETQNRIAAILGALDDKIELNRRMNETLEAMARALFQSWFVDFDPVRVKARGGDPVAELGISAEVAGLFPDSFEESELGEIPKGWRASTVDQEFALTMGQSPPGETYNSIGKGLPFFQGKTDFGFRFPKNRIYCTAPTRLAKPNDTLVSVRAPVGSINRAIEESAIGRGVAAIRHRTGSPAFTYQAMAQLKDVFAKFDQEGTVFGSINKNGFASIPVTGPPLIIIQAFDTVVQGMDDLISSNEFETRSLISTRDFLLPKLLSGEISVLVGGIS